MLGGDKLSGGAKAPGRILIIADSGELAVLDQFTDAAAVGKEEQKKESYKKSGQMMAPGGGPADDKDGIMGLTPDDSKKKRKPNGRK
jgi:hypothetical protein